MEIGYSDNSVEPGFVVEFLNADGDVICEDQTTFIAVKDRLEAMVSLGVGETCSIPFVANTTEGLASFKVSSTYKYHAPKKSKPIAKEEEELLADEEERDNEDKDSGSNSDWDKILDDYEKIVNDYLKVYKKVAAGDMSFMPSYMKLLADLQEFAKDLDGAKDDMTPSQMQRYVKITAKYSEAVLEELE